MRWPSGRSATSLVCVGAVVVPVVVAWGLIPLRDVVVNANVALILVGVVVAIAVAGGRRAGAGAALASAVAFDFFHTLPYLRFRIASQADVETTLLLLGVGLVVGHVAAQGRLARRSAEASQGEIRRIYRVATLAARGEDAPDVILSAQAELTALLGLRQCRFEAPPFAGALPRLERSGLVPVGGSYRLRSEGFELPAEGAELEVLGRGHRVGRFVLEPAGGAGVSLEQRVVAVALADQVGAVLAATGPQPEQKGTRRV